MIKKNEWIGPRKVWISRDMSGLIDIWSREPSFESGWVLNDPFSLCGDLGLDYGGYDSEYKRDVCRFLTKQLGTPKPGELWEVTIKNGTAYCL